MSIKHNRPRKNKMGWKQGYFNVSNSKKYFNPNEPCIYRSSYEYKFMFWCENNDAVDSWGSESLSVKYFCLETGKQRTYWLDFVVYLNNPKEKWLVEVKPSKQVNEGIRFGKRFRNMKTEAEKKNFVMRYKASAKNYSKWVHAKSVAEQKGYKFKIITEDFLNKTYR